MTIIFFFFEKLCLKTVAAVVQGGAPTVVDLTKPGVEPVGAPPLKKAFPALSLSAYILVIIFHLILNGLYLKRRNFISFLYAFLHSHFSEARF